MKFTFFLPVGDYKCEGHGKVLYFLIESDKPIEEVRKAYSLVKENNTSLDSKDRNAPIIDEGENFVSDEWFAQANIEPSNVLNAVNEEAEDQGHFVYDPIEVARIFISLVNQQDPELNLQLLEQPPVFQDDSIGNIGYGIF